MQTKSVHGTPAVERFPGVKRRNLVHNHELMLIHCTLEKGARVPLHSHRASQLNFVISGRIRFCGDSPDESIEVGPGESSIVDPDVRHGCVALEDSAYLEAFTPPRPELLKR